MCLHARFCLCEAQGVAARQRVAFLAAVNGCKKALRGRLLGALVWSGCGLASVKLQCLHATGYGEKVGIEQACGGTPEWPALAAPGCQAARLPELQAMR